MSLDSAYRAGCNRYCWTQSCKKSIIVQSVNVNVVCSGQIYHTNDPDIPLSCGLSIVD